MRCATTLNDIPTDPRLPHGHLKSDISNVNDRGYETDSSGLTVCFFVVVSEKDEKRF